MSTARVVTADTLAAHLAAGHVTEFWNVLTDDYFTGAMIPGSHRVPLDQVGREVAARALPRDTAIVVYCSGPTCPQSGAAGEKLRALGFTDVLVFEGGLQAWSESGRALASLDAAGVA